MQKVTNNIENKHEDCPLRDILELIGDKWSLLILYVLNERPFRFNELKKVVGKISQRVLTQRLRTLERDGYVSRTVYPVSPPKVEYALTDLGLSLLMPLSQLEKWSRLSYQQVKENREKYDQENAL
ncbi:MAG: helix-turn-helix transcriptional regulator [Pseudomonadales bacterium]|nr:helix-turn-helix transcriptional regulator [Pseudomonadales bacterium]